MFCFSSSSSSSLLLLEVLRPLRRLEALVRVATAQAAQAAVDVQHAVPHETGQAGPEAPVGQLLKARHVAVEAVEGKADNDVEHKADQHNDDEHPAEVERGLLLLAARVGARARAGGATSSDGLAASVAWEGDK